jgi:hypothetical protein
MPTKRTWRERQGVAFPSAYQASELLTGEISYPVLGYDGYGDGVGKDHPPIGDDESEDEYLTRTRQWLPGERDLFEAVEREPEPDDDDADITIR